MTEGEATKNLEAEVPLAPSAARNESSFRIEKMIGYGSEKEEEGKA